MMDIRHIDIYLLVLPASQLYILFINCLFLLISSPYPSRPYGGICVAVSLTVFRGVLAVCLDKCSDPFDDYKHRTVVIQTL
jgi:hypothetical protein